MSTLTVYFDDPWWVGVVEDEEGGALRAFRHVFGSEPSNGEVFEFVLYQLDNLMREATPNVRVEMEAPRRLNPKRANREARLQMATHGASTKAQEALRLLFEQTKQTRHIQTKSKREAEADYKHQKAKEKALARKRGH